MPCFRIRSFVFFDPLNHHSHQISSDFEQSSMRAFQICFAFDLTMRLWWVAVPATQNLAVGNHHVSTSGPKFYIGDVWVESPRSAHTYLYIQPVFWPISIAEVIVCAVFWAIDHFRLPWVPKWQDDHFMYPSCVSTRSNHWNTLYMLFYCFSLVGKVRHDVGHGLGHIFAWAVWNSTIHPYLSPY